MGIENLLQVMQQIELLREFENDMGYGQLPDFMLEDRSVKQGEVGHDRMFSNQGVPMSGGSSGGNANIPIELPEVGRPVQENVPVTFSDFFGDPKYRYEHSVMLPKKDEIDD
tara:strand:+ start:1200 stop:1535 length:336 start_codon:yes stop_codon:yes gene_type:complete